MYQHGYDMVRDHQAELRRLVAQERLARQAWPGVRLSITAVVMQLRRFQAAWLGRAQSPAGPAERLEAGTGAGPAVLDDLHVLVVGGHPDPVPHEGAVAGKAGAAHGVVPPACMEGGAHGCGTCPTAE